MNEDTAILKDQCELYLKEKNEAINSAKNLEESYEKKISDLQGEIDFKNEELNSCHQQINLDKDEVKSYKIIAENLKGDFELLESAVLSKSSYALCYVQQNIFCA